MNILQPPFFEVITRCYKRPLFLARNQASLRAQSNPDYTQTLLVDVVGVGVGAANAQLADVEVSGAYVWLLDDDDICIDAHLFEKLKALIDAMREPPAAIVVRMDHGALGVLPPLDQWQSVPPEGLIGVSALVTRRDIWYQYRQHWRSRRYASDYDFISAVLRHETAVVWIDLVASAILRRSLGAPEGS